MTITLPYWDTWLTVIVVTGLVWVTFRVLDEVLMLMILTRLDRIEKKLDRLTAPITTISGTVKKS